MCLIPLREATLSTLKGQSTNQWQPTTVTVDMYSLELEIKQEFVEAMEYGMDLPQIVVVSLCDLTILS